MRKQDLPEAALEDQGVLGRVRQNSQWTGVAGFYPGVRDTGASLAALGNVEDKAY